MKLVMILIPALIALAILVGVWLVAYKRGQKSMTHTKLKGSERMELKLYRNAIREIQRDALASTAIAGETFPDVVLSRISNLNDQIDNS